MKIDFFHPNHFFMKSRIKYHIAEKTESNESNNVKSGNFVR